MEEVEFKKNEDKSESLSEGPWDSCMLKSESGDDALDLDEDDALDLDEVDRSSISVGAGHTLT